MFQQKASFLISSVQKVTLGAMIIPGTMTVVYIYYRYPPRDFNGSSIYIYTDIQKRILLIQNKADVNCGHTISKIILLNMTLLKNDTVYSVKIKFMMVKGVGDGGVGVGGTFYAYKRRLYYFFSISDSFRDISMRNFCTEQKNHMF